ncbi:hypothetical protein L6164_008075 [Bauhinia variegata]|uniref:Uncharacterized protein n=1 Tax=Bauhinia variegata TaxID=167791 RepID=A0ACB9PEL0_BAUVA|nr:hypothetical protein L6164_008075 [Bauhinia variegata]
MGGGGTLMDVIRRLFQRRASIAIKSDDHERIPNDIINKNKNNGDHGRSNRLAFVRDFRSQLTAIPKQESEEGIEEDFDISGLKLVKVPTRTHFKAGSMDPHKKGGLESEFFTEYGEASRYEIQEVIGKGSYGVVVLPMTLILGKRLQLRK